MREWLKYAVAQLMDELGLSEEEAWEKAIEDFFDDGNSSRSPKIVRESDREPLNHSLSRSRRDAAP